MPHSYKELSKYKVNSDTFYRKNILHVITAPSIQGVAQQRMILFNPKTLIGSPHEITKFGRL